MQRCASSGTVEFLNAVTEFIFLSDKPQQSDVIFVPGSSEPDNAEKAADIYKQGYAPIIIPSGRYAKNTGRFIRSEGGSAKHYDGEYRTECEFLTDVLLRNGVPKHAILGQDQATFTWENAKYSKQLIEASGIIVRKAILCCKPWHARRALFYYQAAFPDVKFFVCPSEHSTINRQNWYTSEIGREAVLGELTRCGNQLTDVLENAMYPLESVEVL